jgi:hypothetical protein
MLAVAAPNHTAVTFALLLFSGESARVAVGGSSMIANAHF